MPGTLPKSILRGKEGPIKSRMQTGQPLAGDHPWLRSNTTGALSEFLVRRNSESQKGCVLNTGLRVAAHGEKNVVLYVQTQAGRPAALATALMDDP